MGPAQVIEYQWVPKKYPPVFAMAATNSWIVAPQRVTTIHDFILYHTSNLHTPEQSSRPIRSKVATFFGFPELVATLLRNPGRLKKYLIEKNQEKSGSHPKY